MPASRRPLRAGLLLLLVATSSALGACAAATPSASAPPTPSAVPTSTPVATDTPEPSGTPDSGPVDFATWTEIQGFGGSSGLPELQKEGAWTRDHPSEGTAFDIESAIRLTDNLAAWLDSHAATACWADYHTAMRASLDRIKSAFAAARDARAAGDTVKPEVGAQLVKETQAAVDLPEPAGC